MTSVVLQAHDVAATEVLGARLAAALPAGAVVALNGPLGAGKTQLVRAIAGALGVDPSNVTSPTFVLVNEYPGTRPIYHLDAYRLRDDDEFLQLGPEEFFDSQGFTFIEWGERVERCLPRERLEINIAITSETSRRFDLRALGRRYEAVIEALTDPPNDGVRAVNQV